MIPKIIHYVWFGGKPLPDEYRENIENWKRLMPDYTVMEWNEKNFDVSSSRFMRQAYEAKKFAFVADAVRVDVIEKYGGIYLDTDVKVVKPFDGLLKNEFFIGFENDGNLETAVFGSEPNHPAVRTLTDFYGKANFLGKNKKPDLTPNVIYFTYFFMRDYGLKMKPVNQSLVSFDGGSRISVFSTDYFTPLNFNTRKETVTQNTYAVHAFANSWSTKPLLRAQSLANGVRKLFGKRIFAFFTRVYVRSACRKFGRRAKRMGL